MAPSTVAVAGVTGMFGRQILAALLKHSEVNVHGIARDTSKVSISDSRLQLFNAGASDVDALSKALRATSVCICCYNGPDDLMVNGQKTLIDACIAEGVKRYIASDYSFDVRGLNYGDFPFKDFQLKIIDYLAEREKESQIKGVHCLNGAFQEVIVNPMVGMIDTESDTFRHWATGGEPWDMTTVPDAAAFVARVALDDDASGFIAVRGDKKSIKEIAKLYEGVYNTSVTFECHGTLDELGEKMVALRKAEPNNLSAWLGLHYNYYTLNGATLVNDKDLGRYPDLMVTSLEELMRQTSKDILAGLLAARGVA